MISPCQFERFQRLWSKRRLVISHGEVIRINTVRPKMIGLIRDYTKQTVFVAIQTTVIVYGILTVATLLKGNGYPEYDHFSWLAKFVRHGGVTLFVIPAAWVWLTIWYDRSDRNYSEVFAIGTGVLTVFLLWCFFASAAKDSARRKGPITDQLSAARVEQGAAHQLDPARSRKVFPDSDRILTISPSRSGSSRCA